MPAHLQQLLKNPALDHARGVDEFSEEESSSDDEPSSDEDDEIEYDWGELDKDAQWDVDGHEVEVRSVGVEVRSAGMEVRSAGVEVRSTGV